MAAFTTFVACGLTDPMTSLRLLAEEQDRPAPAETDVRDALATALGAG